MEDGPSTSHTLTRPHSSSLFYYRKESSMPLQEKCSLKYHKVFSFGNQTWSTTQNQLSLKDLQNILRFMALDHDALYRFCEDTPLPIVSELHISMFFPNWMDLSSISLRKDYDIHIKWQDRPIIGLRGDHKLVKYWGGHNRDEFSSHLLEN